MKKYLFVLLAALLLPMAQSDACTNFIITKGASTDASIMVTYSADSHQLYGALYKYNVSAPKKQKKDKSGVAAVEYVPVYEWDTGRYLCEIPQADTTYSTVGNMNERQLIIGETTFGGRSELEDPNGKMDYGSMIYLALQRAKTAREAISVIVDLANTHGYASSGESFSIADKNEAWIFEMIGKGSKMVGSVNENKGIVWVARRIPDGYICAHANQARITQFPLNDPENCLYAKDVISFAREKGYYSGADEDFSFADAYAPLDFGALRGCEARVWSFFKTFNKDMNQYLDYAMGHNAQNRMPLWVKPDRKISPKEVFDAMRDHYEGTPMDMTTDLGAGGNNCPYRWRPMHFKVDGREYLNERATATQQTGFWFVAQARSEYPDPIGGIIWFGVDDAGTSCLTPIYCSVTKVPECLREGNGSMTRYSETASFWIFNRIAQFAYLRYDLVGSEVRKIADEWENERLAEIQKIDKKALSRFKQGNNSGIKYLTTYSVETAQTLFQKWVSLDKYLLVKYIDGNVKKQDKSGAFLDNGNGRDIPVSPEQPGYNQKWKESVVKDNGKTLLVHEVK